MKLNLLPTTVSKGKQAKGAVVFSVLIGIVGIVLAAFIASKSAEDLSKATADNQASIGPAQAAFTESQKADTIMGLPSSVALIRDANLAKAMISHNDVYPSLYDSILPYIPTFFRINSMAATSLGAGTSTITLQGTIKTYQQYADLMLALSRYPGVVSIGRSGFQFDDNIVPNLTIGDQTGTPHKPDQGPVPDEKLARLTYFESQVQPQGYTGVGNFGSGTDNTRGAMPGYSLITVTMTVTKDLQVAQPRETLSASAAAGTTGATGTTGPGGPGAGNGMAGAGPGSGPGGATTGPPTGVGPAATKGKKGDDTADAG